MQRHQPPPVKSFSVQILNVTDLGLKFAIFSSFCVLCWVGDESHIDQTGLLDMSFQSLAHRGDSFGDEDKGFDLLGSDLFLPNFSQKNTMH